MQSPFHSRRRIPGGRALKRLTAAALGLAAALAVMVGVTVGVLRLTPHAPLQGVAPQSRLVEARGGETLRLTLAPDDHFRLWIDLQDVSPSVVEAVLLKEDRAFYRHPGVDPLALVRAAFKTAFGSSRQGASTVSMQLARRLYGIDSRTVPGKLKQIGGALWLEARYGKRDILEAYLNLAPMGGNIEGVEAASRIYFHKPAKDLSLNEALALAVIPQSPTKRARFGPALQTARARLAEDWLSAHPDDVRAESLTGLPVRAFSRKDAPFLAPHYADMLLARDPEATVLRGTLDLGLQKTVEDVVKGYVLERRRFGVANAAVLLVDSRDMSVKAMMGSADFHSEAIKGQVNGTTARRSPGSTIKPFLYALAIDQGVIHPLSILKDAPSAFGSFQPENFDGRFTGPIAARDALIRSRNVPAVQLAAATRNPSLYGFLWNAGVGGLRREESYGLSIALGGGEIRMTELAGLYALLARDGRHRPLRFRLDDPIDEGRPLLTPQAAFITRDMLRRNPRADGLPPDRRGRDWSVAWKTGTSWSYHDAWTAGIVGPYVLIVWVGDFENRQRGTFIGVRSAAPLFFRLSDALALSDPDAIKAAAAMDRPPPGLVRVSVCAASGDLPNRWCPQTRATWFIPGVSPIRVSDLHRPVTIDVRTGLRACPPFDRETTREEVFEFWPSDLLQVFETAGLPRQTPPPENPACRERAFAGPPPTIRSPLANVTYTVRLSGLSNPVGLTAQAGPDVRRLYWFEGGTLLGQTAPGQTLDWRPVRPGPTRIHVSDDHGLSASRTVRVEFVP